MSFDYYTKWFDSYAEGFYNGEKYHDGNIALKYHHSLRVCSEIQWLSRSMGLDPADSFTAELIGLLHDIGRFPQFARYRTFNDSRSEDHGRLGLKVLRGERVLSSLGQAEISLVEKAVELHCVKELPSGLSGKELFFARLIRDADKLDIFHIVTENSDGFVMELGLSTEDCCSEQILDGILEDRQVDYSSMKTWNDIRLLHLSWVYDMNFPASLQKIRQKRYIERIGELLPDTPKVEKVRKKVLSFLYKKSLS